MTPEYGCTEGQGQIFFQTSNAPVKIRLLEVKIVILLYL